MVERSCTTARRCGIKVIPEGFFMPTFIDRRLSPKDKSLGNHFSASCGARDRRKSIKTDQHRQDRRRGWRAYGLHSRRPHQRATFRNDGGSGRRDYVLPGNVQFEPGDRLPKPPAGGGGQELAPSRRWAIPRTISASCCRARRCSTCSSRISNCPISSRNNLKEVVAFKPRRAGYATTSSPSNVSVRRTMRNSYGRRIALRRPRSTNWPKNSTSLEADPQMAAERPARIAELRAEIDRLTRRRKLVAYVDPVDIRFMRFEPQPVPTAKAVMFCLMDVSGSMGEREKDLAKRFFVLLRTFLKRRYDRTEIVFIRHTEAQEVDENTFFYSPQSGGTVVSSALEMRRIIRQRYPSADWNIYAAQASDGDNFAADSQRCITLLDNEIMKLCQYFAYVEIIDEREKHIFGSTENGTSLWRAYHTIAEKWPNFQMSRIARPAEIYPVFRRLFARQPSEKSVEAGMAKSSQRWRLLFSGSDWNFDTLSRTYDVIKAIAQDELHLDTYRNQLEIISSEQMLDAYSSVGMPLITIATGRSANTSSTRTTSTAKVCAGWPTRSSSTPIRASST